MSKDSHELNKIGAAGTNRSPDRHIIKKSYLYKH